MTDQAASIQLATWNVNSLKVRLPHLLQWLETNPVDLLGLQRHHHPKHQQRQDRHHHPRSGGNQGFPNPRCRRRGLLPRPATANREVTEGGN